MASHNFILREAHPSEFEKIGQLMVDVYAALEGFPSPKEQPRYYHYLAHIGAVTRMPKAKLLVAANSGHTPAGAVVYFGDMQYYGSGGTATKEKNACGFRLLAVDHNYRGRGVGRLLTQYCIDIAKKQGQTQMIIHSTQAMQIAWKMYEKIGFQRSEDLDFRQENLEVFGFRLKLF